MRTSRSGFAARLKELREGAAMTQKELAGRAGLTKDGVAQLEQGRREPTWATVRALAQALGVVCQAFEQEPASLPEPKRGRPSKAPSDRASGKEPAPNPPRRHSRKQKGHANRRG